ncbi:MAG: nucleoside hydrolase-like domain-containing protein, partial [Planctomycetota bacterium]
MRPDRIILAWALIICTTALGAQLDVGRRPRVIVSTDIGGSDPDDFQSMVHYLVYADLFDTEGLISSPPQGGRVRDVLECIAAYEKDYVNLRTWSPNYPSPDVLRQVTRQGAIDPQSSDQPSTKISAGARLIIERARVEDPRPVYVLVWGSITDVAQAVHQDPRIKAKLRVHSIGSWNTRQDPKARDYLFNSHRDLWWIESDST